MKKPSRNRVNNDTDRDRAWRVMRMYKGAFSRMDIARLSESNYENIAKYIYVLAKAGYLAEAGHRSMKPKNGHEVLYRLKKNTGPKAPLMKDIDLLYDPNLKSYWAENPEVRLCELGLLPSPFEVPND